MVALTKKIYYIYTLLYILIHMWPYMTKPTILRWQSFFSKATIAYYNLWTDAPACVHTIRVYFSLYLRDYSGWRLPICFQKNAMTFNPSRFLYTRVYIGHTHKVRRLLNARTRAAVNVSNKDKEKSRARNCPKSNKKGYGERFVSSCRTLWDKYGRETSWT